MHYEIRPAARDTWRVYNTITGRDVVSGVPWSQAYRIKTALIVNMERRAEV